MVPVNAHQMLDRHMPNRTTGKHFLNTTKDKICQTFKKYQSNKILDIPGIQNLYKEH